MRACTATHSELTFKTYLSPKTNYQVQANTYKKKSLQNNMLMLQTFKNMKFKDSMFLRFGYIIMQVINVFDSRHVDLRGEVIVCRTALM